jgi:hypothetical protein
MLRPRFILARAYVTYTTSSATAPFMAMRRLRQLFPCILSGRSKCHDIQRHQNHSQHKTQNEPQRKRLLQMFCQKTDDNGKSKPFAQPFPEISQRGFCDVGILDSSRGRHARCGRVTRCGRVDRRVHHFPLLEGEMGRGSVRVSLHPTTDFGCIRPAGIDLLGNVAVRILARMKWLQWWQVPEGQFLNAIDRCDNAHASQDEAYCFH